MKYKQKPFYLLMVLALLAGLLGFQPAKPVQAANALRISQVYGGGGLEGATFTHDFFEIFNSGSSAVSLNGMSIQYASGTGGGNLGGTASQITELPDILLEAGQYYLIQGASGSIGDPLPLTPDLTDTTPINASGSAGKVALINSQESLGCNGGSTACDAEQLALIVDLIGYGITNFYEGSGSAPLLSSSTSAQRADGGCTDTDDNAADFVALAPVPRNTASPTNSCGPVEIFPTDLFFSEYIEGSSNNKALEIYNGTGAAVDLSNYQILYFNNGSLDPLIYPMTGTVAAGDVYVLTTNAADLDPILRAASDVELGYPAVVYFNGDDALALQKINPLTTLDVIGQIGVDPGSAWGTEPITTVNHTLTRMDSICEGDPDGSDPFDPADEWDGWAQDDFTHIGSHDTNCFPPTEEAPTVISTVPADGAVNVAVDANIIITFSEPVIVTGDWFTNSCTESGTHTAVVTDAGPEFTLVPDPVFDTGETCTVTVLADNVTDNDTEDPPDNMEANYVFTFDTVEACGDPFTAIYAIQGSGDTSPLVGQTVTTEGIVVGDFQDGGKNGFFIQDETGDGNDATSDGIFVYYKTAPDVNVGDKLRLTGSVSEYYGATQITGSSLQLCSTGNSIAPTPVSLPVTTVDDFEKYEGMLVTFPQSLIISEYFNFDRYGEIVLTSDRHMTPTALVEPGPDAVAAAQAYLLDRITLDDGRTSQNPDPAIHPNGLEFTMDNLFRGGGTVAGVTGVMDYDHSLYRVQLTEGGTYVDANPRTTEPDIIESDLKIASFNVLNYFVTLDNGPDICGPSGTLECRGADDAEEFTRQKAKIVAAMAAINADIFGLMEIENDSPISSNNAVADLVDGLNAVPGTDTYAYIDTGAIGTDAIKQAIIYKPNSVTPVGDYHILDSSVDSRFIDTKNRPVIAQVFEDNETGEQFVVAVNHLKSKGSCPEPGDDYYDEMKDIGDGQSCWSPIRLAAAEAMVEWLANPTYFPDVEKKLIIGDLNSYDKEDPIDAIKLGSDDTADTEDDYLDLIFELRGDDAYGYVFDGQTGYLDHALANLAMAENIVDVNFWHINADEPDMIDYDMSFKEDAQDDLYAPDAYRSSDHDPVIVTLEFNASPIAQDQEVTTAKNTSIEITLVATDADGDELTYAIVDQPTNGTVVLVGNIATYTPANDYIGPDSFTFKANDGELDSTVATVSITVTDTDYYLYLPIILK